MSDAASTLGLGDWSPRAIYDYLSAYPRAGRGEKAAATAGSALELRSARSATITTQKISYDDLIDSGMHWEIAGRINRIIFLQPLTAADLTAILTSPVLDDLQAAGKCKVEIDAHSAEALAEQAVSTGLGVRWMKSKITNALDDLVFDNSAAAPYTISMEKEML